MSKLDELEKLADAATPGPWWREDEEDSSYSMVEAKGQTIVKLHSEGNCEFIAAANPATIKQLIALVKQCKDALGKIKGGGLHEAICNEALTAIESFERGGS